MIIAGAGGHGLEVAFVLKEFGFYSSDIFYYDEDLSKSDNSSVKEAFILKVDALKSKLKQDPRFVLGVGNPIFREKLYRLLTSYGGKMYGIGSSLDAKSIHSKTVYDEMPYSFVGPETKIGLGVLVNTRAHVHHECTVGDFSEIGPGAMLLGGSKIGRACRIGAGAIILPGIELADQVIVGAGAVVTKSVLMPSILVGIPAHSVSQ